MSQRAAPVALHWSGGKDSAHALHRLLADPRHEVCTLVTTVYGDTGRSSVHGLPVPLLQAQADAAGLPLEVVVLPGDNLTGYVEAMATLAVRMRSEGIEGFAFGDLHHSDVLAMKEEQFAPYGIRVVEPLWDYSSAECIEAYLGTGIGAITVVLNADVLGTDHLGVGLDRNFIASLPAGCDPCGEFGEYHTFVHHSPDFTAPVGFRRGEVERLSSTIGTSDGPRTFRYWRLPLRPA